MEIPVLLETSEIIAVDKPVSISVHNNEDPLNLLKLLKSRFGGELYPIHRLDKETSGIQLFAKSSEAAKNWSHEFQTKNVVKIYCGITKGIFQKTEGVWLDSLTDKSEGRKNPQGNPRDRIACETRYRVLKNNRFFSFLEFNLITGRQHQIRKHSALQNHPLLGDPRYNDPKYNQKMANIYRTERMFLHCQEIEIKNERIISSVPDIFHQILKD